jgi:hypothetical protein
MCILRVRLALRGLSCLDGLGLAYHALNMWAIFELSLVSHFDASLERGMVVAKRFFGGVDANSNV